MIQDRHAGDAVLGEHVDDIYDRGVHSGGFQIGVCAHAKIAQRLPQHLCLLDVDCDELENPVLRDDTDEHSTLRLVVNVD